MKNKIGISGQVIKEILFLAEKCGIHKLILFGSRARGDFKERSDIDLAVSGGDILAFTLALEEDTSTLLFFDVVNLDLPVQPDLCESIKKEGIMLYEKV